MCVSQFLVKKENEIMFFPIDLLIPLFPARESPSQGLDSLLQNLSCKVINEQDYTLYPPLPSCWFLP